jgi:2-amino-4-hydroxy-6-hydroxymethyldihydropteridine diphosphokinase
MSRNKVYLLTGGNVGERNKNLETARDLIESRCGLISGVSAIYETEAWGKSDQQQFLNQVILCETDLNPISLMQEILSIETFMGRTRNEKYGPRTIDIDILFYNEEIIHAPQLTIPHPELQNRRFVLQPLDEIAPGFFHPVFHKTIHQLLIECTDKLHVQKI